MLITKGADAIDILHKLNADAENVSKWFKQNRLPCNVSKTKVLKFSNVHYLHKNIPISVSLNNQTVDEVNQFKYVGLNFVCHLNFEIHANKIASKVRSCTAAMWQCWHFIPLELAKTLYGSLIEQHFIYGCIHYDGCKYLTDSSEIGFTFGVSCWPYVSVQTTLFGDEYPPAQRYSHISYCVFCL